MIELPKIAVILVAVCAAALAACAPEAVKPDYAAQYRPILTTYTAVWNGEVKPEELDKIISANYRQYGTGSRSGVGVAVIRDLIVQDRIAYPDVRLTTDDEYFMRDRAFRLWRSTASNTGPGEMPPSGKHFKNAGMTEFDFKDGQIVKEVTYYKTEEVASLDAPDAPAEGQK